MQINYLSLFSNNNKKLPFKRSLKEHKSWGVNVDEKNLTTSVKIFSYLDAKAVSLLINPQSDKFRKVPLENKQNGIFETTLPDKQLKTGDLYQFEIEKADGQKEIVKDPYSFKQPTLLGSSEVYNHNDYKWSDDEWFEEKNKSRISRLANEENGLLPVSSAIIYEINIATLTNGGDFESAENELDKIKKLGFNAIEIMPTENTYSYNWGYDGVDKFAPSQFLGGPDKLKQFINKAHNIGLNVIMDMVPNHLGPDGAQLQKTGPYIKGSTNWGDAFNYEGENSRYVRDFMVNAAMNWVSNYHCDGLRLDMTKFMKSDTQMQQIAAEMNYHYPHTFLIAEDARSNISTRGDEFWYDDWQPHDERVINPLKPNEYGYGENEEIHNNKINDIENAKVPLVRLGYDSEWDFHFYHTLTKIAYNEADLDAIERAVADSKNRIKYTTSHDETGNLDGTRLTAKYMVPLLNLLKYTFLDENDIERAKDYQKLKIESGINFTLDNAKEIVKSQKTQLVSMKLAQMIQKGEISKYLNADEKTFNDEILYPLGIDKNSNITAKSLIEAFEFAIKKYRAIETLKYFTPGPVMTFQGEDRLEMVKFNFFREFQSNKDEKFLYTQKGYPNGLPAYLNSKLGSMKYDISGQLRMEKFQNLIRDLNEFKMQNPAATSGEIVVKDTIKHYNNPTIAFHSIDKNSSNELFIISNFSSKDYPNYEIKFPNGCWIQAINTNSSCYGGDDKCVDFSSKIFGNDYKQEIALPAWSSVIYVKQN